MESSIAVFLSRQPACERLPTMQPPTVCAKTCCYAPLLCACCCLLRSRPRAAAGCCALTHRWRAPLAARTAGSCCCCVAAAVAVTAAAALLCACYLLRLQPPLLRLPPGLDWVWVAAQTRAFSTSNLTQNSTHRAPEQGWWFHSKRVGAADSGPPCVIGACLHAHAHRPPWTHYW